MTRSLNSTRALVIRQRILNSRLSDGANGSILKRGNYAEFADAAIARSCVGFTPERIRAIDKLRLTDSECYWQREVTAPRPCCRQLLQ